MRLFTGFSEMAAANGTFPQTSNACTLNANGKLTKSEALDFQARLQRDVIAPLRQIEQELGEADAAYKGTMENPLRVLDGRVEFLGSVARAVDDSIFRDERSPSGGTIIDP